MSEPWVVMALGRLQETTTCPGCGALLGAAECRRCGINLTDSRAVQVLEASHEAIATLQRREEILRELRHEARAHLPSIAPAEGVTPAHVAMPGGKAPSYSVPDARTPVPPGTSTQPVGVPTRPLRATRPPAPVPPRSAPTIGLQQVLAAAGAGLVAVATVVFVFFTFADSLMLRSLVTGAVTLVAGAIAILLRRQRLTATAESLAALTAVLLLVDVELLLSSLDVGERAGLVRGILYATICAALLLIARRSHMKSWAVAGALVIPVIPILLGSGLFALGQHDADITLSYWTVTLSIAAISTWAGARFGRWATDGTADGTAELPVVQGLLTAIRCVAYALAALAAVGAVGSYPSTSAALLFVCAATAAVLALLFTQKGWWVLAGMATVSGAAAFTVSDSIWTIAVAPAVGLLAWLILGVAVRPLKMTDRIAVLSGGAILQAVITVPAFSMAGKSLVELSLPDSSLDDLGTSTDGFMAAPWGLTSTFLLLVVAARMTGTVQIERRTTPSGSQSLDPAFVTPVRTRVDGAPEIVRTARLTAPWILLLVLVTVANHPDYLPMTALLVPVALAAAALSALQWPPRGLAVVARRYRRAPYGRLERASWRAATTTAVFVFIVAAAANSWGARPVALLGGGLVLLLLLAARHAVAAAAGPWLVALGYGYALVVLGMGLSWTDLDLIAVLCSVSAAASLVAIVCTRIRRIGRTTWWAILATTSVPFLLGVATLLDERSWWSAGAAVVMLGLELVLLLTHRDGAVRWLRAASALVALPTAAVVTVSVGAMVITGSAAQIVLPIITTLTGATLLSAAPIASKIGVRAPDSGMWVRAAIEISVALTGAVAVLLAAVRPSAGGGVTIAVLTILAAAVSVLAARPDRRLTWWIAATLWVAALWTTLGTSGVAALEAYTGPPAVVAVVTGIVLARHRSQWWSLAVSGAALGIVPTLIALGIGDFGPGDARLWVLGVGGAALCGGAVVARRSDSSWVRRAGVLAAGSSILAAMGGLIGSLWVGAEGFMSEKHLFWTALAYAVGAAVLAGVGGRVAVSLLDGGSRWWQTAASRWWAAPALVFLAVGATCGVRYGWAAALTMLTLELGLLALTVLTVRRGLRGRFDLPPTWFVWLTALTVAIGGWSTRELFRVEVFSIPLGVGLLLAGWLALRATMKDGATADDGGAESGMGVARAVVPGAAGGAGVPGVGAAGVLGGSARLRAWPVGYAGSWRTLAPGLLALVGPSVLSTHTDPLTWRAVLVVAIALACVLFGTQRHLAAPFVLGVAVLPIEVLVVFISQLDTRIDASSWMLTLGAAGGLLLIIATQHERRIAKYGGASAYVRDLH